MKLDGSGLPHVVILGCGFGGLNAALRLQKAGVRLTVIDRRNHHLFQPLLYQVATAVLNPSDIAAPIRRIVRGQNVSVILGEASAIDLEKKTVRLVDGEVPYHYLVVATGSTHSYFGHDEWAEFAPGLKSIEDALQMRSRVLFAYEAAERESDPELQRQWLTFVVVGGGPTGVELAGALAEISRKALADDFHNFDPAQAKVVLVEGGPHVLGAYPTKLSEKARRSLERLGVDVRTGTVVTDVRCDGVQAGPHWISARTVLWGAGVAASPLARSMGVPLDRAGRVPVTPQLTVPGHDDVFIVGDLAALEQDGKLIAGVAPAAMQEGKHAAKNIIRSLKGQPMLPFRYWDRGIFSVIGRGSAVGIAFEKLKVSGFFAWAAWLAIHIFFLIGFRNRIAVLMNWAYSFFTLKRNAQLITGEDVQRLPEVCYAPEARKSHPGAAKGAAGDGVPSGTPPVGPLRGGA